MGGDVADSDKPAYEEEFYYLLTEGSELLQAGKIDEARVHFERALKLSPSHEQALNLLGLSLFRLNHLDRARQIFEDLVHNNPVEPSLRLNLAMVHLKTARLGEAKLELERVLELSPDHPRATSYMGLVLERQGDLEHAAQFYERAGNQKRADEIRAYRPTPTGTFPLPNLQAMITQTQAAQARAQVPVAKPSPPMAKPPVIAPTAALAASVASLPPRLAQPTLAAPIAVTPPAVVPPVPAVSAPLKELGLAGLMAGAISAEVPVLRDDGILAFPITDVGYVRTDLLIAFAGQFNMEPVHRRYRGKRTDSLFGGPDAGIVALLGTGLALLLPSEREILLLSLRSEELYLVEGSLLAFTQGLVWENGRLPSASDRDLDIVHLRGSGRLAIGTESPLVALEVRPDRPVTVHAARLVGWHGQLVPFRAPLPGLPESARAIPVVRFEGAGMVLAI